MSAAQGSVAILGGTFNPVHYGHLRSALELVERLGLTQLRLMPCATPPHREQPHCSAHDRAAMVELAVEGEPRLFCDRRELGRPGHSYTIDSLAELRGELGDTRSMSLVMGCDAVHSIDTWRRWRELLDLAHVVVIARPGWRFPDSGVVVDWLRSNALADRSGLADAPAGGILVEELRPLAISSTEIRQLLHAGQSPRYLLPESVLAYIRERKLYV